MMRAGVVAQPFWQQKHPTPSHAGWDFHWHPAGLEPALVDAVTALDVRRRLRGGGPATLWQLGGDAAIWLRTFTAFVPSEQRDYLGLAGVWLRPGPAAEDRRAWPACLPGALARLELPAAAPLAADADPRPRPLAADPLAMATIPAAQRAAVGAGSTESWGSLLRAVCHGGAATLPRPLDERLPELAGRALSWLPAEALARPRVGLVAEAAAVDKPPAQERHLYHYLGCACSPPDELAAREPGYPAAAWRLVLELAAATGRDLSELFGELTRVSGAWDTAPALRDHLLRSGVLGAATVEACDRSAPAPLFADGVPDAGWQWNRLLHYWGRGFLPDDRELVARIATLLAHRIVADHLFRLDHPRAVEQPGRYLRRLRIEALLRHDARERLLGALAAVLPSLLPRPAARGS
jgi:hypothetical protein